MKQILCPICGKDSVGFFTKQEGHPLNLKESPAQSKIFCIECNTYLRQCGCGEIVSSDGHRGGTGKDRKSFFKSIKGVIKKWVGK